MPSASTICFASEPQRCADAGGRPDRAEDRGRVKARFVHGLRHHEAQSTKHFGADRNPGQRITAVRMMALAGGQHRRHDHRPRVHRAAFKRVVEILAMR